MLNIISKKNKKPPPKISVIVIVYRMAEQARKTLYSLSINYQQSVSEEDYEVIIVENISDSIMGGEVVNNLQGNFKYFLRKEKLSTPVPAIQFGFEQCAGQHIALMIDGARMATPGLLYHLILASRLDNNIVTSVPGYHLGKRLQQESKQEGYNESVEQKLLESINWPHDGYRLFDVGCLSATSQAGFFLPMGESNCFCVPRHIWDYVGGVDPQFTASGGGLANLDYYKRVCELDCVKLALLAGEGTFHQFHDGITTGGLDKKEREKTLKSYFEQYEALRGKPYKAPKKVPLIIGSITGPALKYMQYSVKKAQGFFNK